MNKNTLQSDINIVRELPPGASIRFTSDTSDWCYEPLWEKTPKRFFVSVVDSEINPIPGVPVSISGDPAVVELNHINQGVVTSAAGVAICYCTVKRVGSAPGFSATATVGEASSSSSSSSFFDSAELGIAFSPISEQFPRIPAAADGIIDEDDYNHGISVTITSEPTLTFDAYLYWGESTEIGPIRLSDSGATTINLTEPNGEYLHLLANGRYVVKYFSVDAGGNGLYSDYTAFNVDRGINGLINPILDPAISQQGEDGFINYADNQLGVTITLPNVPFTYTDSSGTEVTIDSPLEAADSCTIYLQGTSSTGFDIPSVSLLIPGDELVPDSSNTYTTEPDLSESSPLHVLFNSISEGSVSIDYFLSINGLSFSAQTVTRYNVDVNPPGLL